MTILPGLPPIVTMTSGMSHRLILPSPLSSVRFATSGVVRLPTKPPSPSVLFHVHFVTGANEFGGDDCVQSSAAPLSLSGGTTHLSTGPPSPVPPSPPSPKVVV